MDKEDELLVEPRALFHVSLLVLLRLLILFIYYYCCRGYYNTLFIIIIIDAGQYYNIFLFLTYYAIINHNNIAVKFGRIPDGNPSLRRPPGTSDPNLSAPIHGSRAVSGF